MLVGKNNNIDNKAEKLEKTNKNNIDIFIANLYSYVIIIAYMYWRKQDEINCFKSFSIFYLYYSLCITNIASIINYKICFNLNLLEISFQISYDLDLKT